MKCKGIKLLLADYANGELGKEKEIKVSRHLKECAACRQEAEQLKRVQILLKADLVPNPPEAFWPALTKQTLQRIEQEQIPWWEKIGAYLRTPSYALGLAGSALLLLAALIFLIPKQTTNKHHIALNAISHENTEENSLYPGMDEEPLSQLSNQELEEVAQTIYSKSNIEDESLAHQTDEYELLYQLDGHQVEYLSQQLENLSNSTSEETNET